MYNTQNKKQLLNNLATEPEISYAEYPSEQEQNKYALQGGIAVLFVTFLVLIAFSVS